jgi:phosphoenolpyruvate carboxykinase (ATP)
MSPVSLNVLGPLEPKQVHAHLTSDALVDIALARGEGVLASSGALAVRTGARTGRSPRDRFIVAHPSVEKQVWWGPINQPLDPAIFDRLMEQVRSHCQDRELFVFDGWAGADPRYRLAVRVISETAWHSLFARTLFLRPSAAELEAFEPQFTVLNASSMVIDPGSAGLPGTACIALDFPRRIILIAGTEYAGEIKKSIFSTLNYLLPDSGVFPMHCAANVGAAGDTALFFGLSGTGKTTLSADPERRLIGDDEHGWSDTGVFNFEGGCYAKTIRLSREGEPQIWNAIRSGSVLENVPVDPVTGLADYDDDSITENTRCTYPIDHIENCEPSGQGGHPQHVVFLTCDAFGVLPPISRLSHDQASCHFLSGYTAKVAGTETGVTQPQATFSTCFGAPFMPLHPERYGELLRARLRRHGAEVWLLNTGWSGGPAGKAPRMQLMHTRALLRAALAGQLAHVPYAADPVFGLQVPTVCPDVPPQILQPRKAWSDPAAYDAAARRLADLFDENLRTFTTRTSTEG